MRLKLAYQCAYYKGRVRILEGKKNYLLRKILTIESLARQERQTAEEKVRLIKQECDQFYSYQ